MSQRIDVTAPQLKESNGSHVEQVEFSKTVKKTDEELDYQKD